MAKKTTAAADGGNETGAAGVTAETTPEITETGAEIVADMRSEAEAEAEKILADARAEAEVIIAAAQKKAKKTAAAEPKAPAVPPGEELVPIRLFKDNDKYKDDVFVAVNGERVQIRRGETVMIKRKFADVLEQSMKQDMATAGLIERESSRYDEEAKARGL